MKPFSVATVGIAMLVMPTFAPTQDAAAASRQARVLALLQRIPTEHSQLGSVQVAAATNAHGCAIVAPAVLGLCGTGWLPAFDADLARQLAAELCRIYGLTVQQSVAAPNGVAAQLDAFDAEIGIALELRGTVEPKPLAHGGAWPTVADEPAASDLDVAEHRELLAAKLRVHTADVQSFWGAPSQDRMTTTLCYLASVGAFLNDVTDGEDVDWGALPPRDGRWLSFELPKERAGLGVEAWSGGGGCTLVVGKATEVVLAVDPARSMALREGGASGALPNHGRPVALRLHGGSETGATVAIALRQRGKDGRERILATSQTDHLFAPGDFDATRSFAFVLSLPPGRYRLQNTGWIGGAPAKRS
jgi:hypothetical protein